MSARGAPKFYNRGGGCSVTRNPAREFVSTKNTVPENCNAQCFRLTVTPCSAHTPTRWHKGRGEETPKRSAEDMQALPFSGKEKRRDLAFQDAEWRTWTLQSANCCVKTKLVLCKSIGGCKRSSKTRAKTVNFDLELPSVVFDLTLVPGKFGSR